MALIPFGKVSVASAGTPVRATSNLEAPTARKWLQSVMFQALPGNAGRVYIYHSRITPGDDRSNLTKAIAILPHPTSATDGPFPSASFSQPGAVVAVDLAQIWIDCDNGNTDGVIVMGTTGEGVD